ncbi:type I glyceraldehyde-3-phosphate dehydrogenase [Dasania marina]|uniref:type I glyceraldehyde-3-phosphate dehydrogenase n=1 Tax=Dasania marina TaxID=471499 RepID=UPI00036A8F0E|nr:glyceraldehyde 3-phosphate dehydrogenase NAD-binding domain-containing protein [Dasania marina]
MIRLAINGYGRVGRCVLRALYEGGYREHMQVVAINEPADLPTIVHLTKYDSTHGRFKAEVSSSDGALLVNGDSIAISHHRSLSDLPWRQHQVDLVLECSGRFDSQADLQQHLAQGAKRVLLSQPGEADINALVYGVNHQQLSVSDTIASAASCTSNCIVPVIDILHQAFTIESGGITTIHSVMNDQPVLDGYHHTDLRKTRASSQSIIPVDTGLAQGIDRLLPCVSGRFTARALRVPTTNVSAMDLSIIVKQTATSAEVNERLQAASEQQLKGIIGISHEPLASCDFNHDTRSGVVDAAQTRVNGRLVNVLVWFDNEWAYANRMLDISQYWYQQQ